MSLSSAAQNSFKPAKKASVFCTLSGAMETGYRIELSKGGPRKVLDSLQGYLGLQRCNGLLLQNIERVLPLNHT